MFSLNLLVVLAVMTPYNAQPFHGDLHFEGKEIKSDAKPATDEEMIMLLKALSHLPVPETEDIDSDYYSDEDSQEKLADGSLPDRRISYKIGRDPKRSVIADPNNSLGGHLNSSLGVHRNTRKNRREERIMRELAQSAKSEEKLPELLRKMKELNISVYSTNFDLIV